MLISVPHWTLKKEMGRSASLNKSLAVGTNEPQEMESEVVLIYYNVSKNLFQESVRLSQLFFFALPDW